MANTNGTPVLKVARPTILVAGNENAALAQRLISVMIAETVYGLARCETVVSNWGDPGSGSTGFVYFDRQVLEFGKAFAIKVVQDTLFDGRIMGLEAQFPEGRQPQIAVLAEDRCQDLRMVRRTRTFDNVSDSDVFNRIAGEHGLGTNVNVNGPSYRVLAQINQSDLAFLRERARAIDAEVWVSGTTLNAQMRTSRGTGGPLTLTYQQGLREFTVLADLAAQRTAVKVNGWDVAGKAALTHEATDSVLGSELNGDASGASILASALGQRKDSLAHTVPLGAAEARAEAEAVFKMAARRFVVGRGIADTDGKLRVGNLVDLQGLGPLFSGKYYLTEVYHLFDNARGLRTEFTAERPGLGKP
jgi:phage protein D